MRGGPRCGPIVGVHDGATREVAADAETTAVKTPDVQRPAAHTETARLLTLQRSIGNRRTGRVLARLRWNAVSGTIEELMFSSARSRFADAIGPDIAAAGQFQFTLLIAPPVQAVFDPLASAKWTEDVERQTVVELWKSFSDQLFSAHYKDADSTRKVLSQFVREAKSPEAAALVPYLGTDADASYGAAAKIFQEHWKSGKGKPDVSRRRTVAHLFAFRRWEAQACKATATYAAKRLPGTGKWDGKRSSATSIPETPLTVKKTSNPKETGWKQWLGDVFVYRDDLPAIVAKMARALDDGWTIHVRVLSGSVGSDEEHSILLIGHYDGRVFYFFDPDVGGSNIYTPGYDRLYFSKADNLLTTATDRSDLTVWDANVGAEAGGFEGWHTSGGRHRYQAMRLWTE
jgi:hypothetical protein